MSNYPLSFSSNLGDASGIALCCALERHSIHHMVTLLNSSSHPCRAGLLGSQILEVHFWETATVGNALFWEQRSWLLAMKYSSLALFRGREKENGTLQLIVYQFELDASVDYSCNSRERADDAIKTTVFSTRMLLAWLYLMMYKDLADGRNEFCVHSIQRIGALCPIGAQTCDSLPGISVRGITLAISASACMSVDQLVRVYPGIHVSGGSVPLGYSAHAHSCVI